MADHSSSPIDLRIKRKQSGIDDDGISTKKKSRHLDNEIPLDLSVKAQSQFVQYPLSTPTIPFYNPANLFFNSSALLYDLFLANFNSYCQQQQQQQLRTKPEPVQLKLSKQQSTTTTCNRLQKDNLIANKHESYACACGERYSNVAQLVSHLKITNHNAQLSSTHDEVAKLVRGQDIWLSRDTNPANQILKCLRCSLSFETLPDLTAHMMKTNHFTQLLPSISSSPSLSSLPNLSQHSNAKQSQPQQQQQQSQHSPTKLSNTYSRSTCLVCSQQFMREVDLVDHLQRLHQIRYNCTTCGMYFENESVYKEHLIKEMHHRSGKTNKSRDHSVNSTKTSQKRSIIEDKLERSKSSSPIDKEIERLTAELLDRVAATDESSTNTNANALSLLQNFVIKQTSSNNLIEHKQIDMNNNCDDENSNHSTKNLSYEKFSLSNATKSSENPLASLEKMLAYSTIAVESPSTSIQDTGPKKKKFEKYRVFAEKMIRSTLS